MGGFEPFWHEYTYDNATGNRTALVKRSSLNTVTTASYSYPVAGADRPHAVSEVTGPASVSPGSYSYDDAGNMTGRPGQTITFNEVGKVSKVVSGSVTQDIVYNVDGSILSRTDSVEGATLFVGDTVLSQAAGASVVAGVRTYSGAEGKPVAEKSAKTGTTGTTVTWVFSNLEGTVDVQTVANAAGMTTRTIRDPYGAPLGSSGVWGSGTGYMNKPATASTGLTTVGARTYDPVLGKFLSVDPVIDPNLPQQNTGYTYSGNNPTTYKDPSGLKWSIEGYKKPTTYTLPPGFYSARAQGQKFVNQGKKQINDNKIYPLTTPWAEINERAAQQAAGYIKYDFGQIIMSEQGALVYAWMRGNLPQSIAFGAKSRITQGLSESDAAEDYRMRIAADLTAGLSPKDWFYRAGELRLDNPKVTDDIKTFAVWEGSSNSARSLAVIGSHNYSATVISRPSPNTAIVQITASNDMTLGSLMSPIRGYANQIPGDTGAFSKVNMTFTWTETIAIPQ